MKRLNSETGKPFVRGYTRADGFLFWRYNTTKLRRTGYFAEDWYSPLKFKNQVQKTIEYENKHADKFKAIRLNWEIANKKHTKQYRSDWSKNNRDRKNIACAKRRTAKLKRTPPWLTQEHLQQIESVYALAKQLTDETGIVHHVDHIVPLQGETVSGLHVPWNLRAIPATENQSKSNKW